VSDRLPELEAESFDACLCDPPYELGFMGKSWDRTGVAFRPETWAAVLRALKPGAFLLAFGGTRTYHRLACAIEDAGFEIRDSVLVPGSAWVHGQGFPKSMDISKAVDRSLGNEREKVRPRSVINHQRQLGNVRPYMSDPNHVTDSDVPASSASALWSGYGTALKPAWEPVVVAMKPLSGTFAENALRHGVAGLNIDGCRIGTSKSVPASPSSRCSGDMLTSKGSERDGTSGFDPNVGRWPANLILVHHPECIHPEDEVHEARLGFEAATRSPTISTRRLETGCHPDCPVAELDRQSGNLQSGYMAAGTRREGIGWHGGLGCEVRNATVGVAGPASRFFYCAKVSPAERAGSRHPTLKPVDLCAYLAKLILPPERSVRMPISGPCPHCASGRPLGDLFCCDGSGRAVVGWTITRSPRRLLVPFSGAGSEIMGALRVGWEDVTGIEKEAESIADAHRRIAGDAPLLNRVDPQPERGETAPDPEQLDLGGAHARALRAPVAGRGADRTGVSETERTEYLTGRDPGDETEEPATCPGCRVDLRQYRHKMSCSVGGTKGLRFYATKEADPQRTTTASREPAEE
jgi:hypothetical protein